MDNNIEKMKKAIAQMSYRSLLHKWRFEKIGSPWFSGEVGDYFKKVMAEKRKQVTDQEHISTSKKIGWNE